MADFVNLKEFLLRDGRPRNPSGQQGRSGLLDDFSGDFNEPNVKAQMFRFMEGLLAEGKTMQEVIQLFRESLKDMDAEIAVVTKMLDSAKEAVHFQHGHSSKNARDFDAKISSKDSPSAAAAKNTRPEPTPSTSAAAAKKMNTEPIPSTSAATTTAKKLAPTTAVVSIKKGIFDNDEQEENAPRYSPTKSGSKFPLPPAEAKTSSTRSTTTAVSNAANFFLTNPSSSNMPFEKLSKLKDKAGPSSRLVKNQKNN